MTTKRVADVVFCIDASNSMQPCIDAVRKNLAQFVSGLQSGGQSTWDVRFDFLAHQASENARGSSIDGRRLPGRALHPSFLPCPPVRLSRADRGTAVLREAVQALHHVPSSTPLRAGRARAAATQR